MNRFFIVSAMLHALTLLLMTYSLEKNPNIDVQVEYQPPGHANRKLIPVEKMPKTVISHVEDSTKTASSLSSDETNDDAVQIQDSPLIGSDIGIAATYPRLSRALGEVGNVTIQIIQNNRISTAQIQKSSGFSRLDESALSATQSALNRGTLDSYLKYKNQFQISFVFRLVDSPK